METNIKKLHIVFTGGHVTPAQAVIQELQQRGYKNISFIGRRYTDRQQKDISFEYQEITRQGISYYDLQTGRLARHIGFHSALDIWYTVKGIFGAHKLIQSLKPGLVMSFGGYIALPVCLSAKMQGVPIVTHEQTMAPGLANKIIGRIADKVLVAFPETRQRFDSKKVVVTGNPIRQALQTPGKALFTLSGKPILFVTGGSLGAHAINVHIEAILEELTRSFVVIHQTGNVAAYQDYERLAQRASKDYWPYANLSAEEIAWVYHHAHLIIARAGANTLTELIQLKKPAILMPLPRSGAGEQQKHADFFASKGLGKIFDQSRQPQDLLELINRTSSSLATYTHNHAVYASIDNFKAAARIADIIESCAK